MRFMIIVKATEASEAGVMPEEKPLSAMADYHQELSRAVDRFRDMDRGARR